MPEHLLSTSNTRREMIRNWTFTAERNVHHHRISFMELGHLLTRSGLTYPEVSSKVYQDSFCQLGSSISLPWVIYFEAFCLRVVSSFSCIPVICPKLVLFLTHLQFVRLFCYLSKCILLFFSCISSWEFLGIKVRRWISFQRRKGVAAERTSRGWHI